MQNHFDLTDLEFETQFKNCELNPTLFNHEAHLRLAWIYINKYGITRALENIEQQLKLFVAHVGAEEKYHKTLTILAVRAVYHFMNKAESNAFKTFINTYSKLKTDFKELVNSHYTFDIFVSQTARKKFIEPDLHAFD